MADNKLERLVEAQEWLQQQPHCIPGCDGDLAGEDHGEGCPLYGRTDLRGSVCLPLVELLIAYGAKMRAANKHAIEEIERPLEAHINELELLTSKALELLGDAFEIGKAMTDLSITIRAIFQPKKEH